MNTYSRLNLKLMWLQVIREVEKKNWPKSKHLKVLLWKCHMTEEHLLTITEKKNHGGRGRNETRTA